MDVVISLVERPWCGITLASAKNPVMEIRIAKGDPLKNLRMLGISNPQVN